MPKERIVSKFRQNRSTSTKQKIIDSAERYFSENGYYASSIQKLAAAAEVSVGSFYFYFKDKEELLIEVYRKQHERLLQTIQNELSKTDSYRADRKAWLRAFIHHLLDTYGISGKLRAELKTVNYGNERIAVQRREIRQNMFQQMMESIGQSLMIRDLRVKHPQIAFLFIIDMVDATYDRTADEEPLYRKEDVIEECFDAIYKYLFL